MILFVHAYQFYIVLYIKDRSIYILQHIILMNKHIKK